MTATAKSPPVRRVPACLCTFLYTCPYTCLHTCLVSSHFAIMSLYMCVPARLTALPAPYTVMAYIVIAYVLRAYTLYGLYSYGLQRCQPCTDDRLCALIDQTGRTPSHGHSPRSSAGAAWEACAPVFESALARRIRCVMAPCRMPAKCAYAACLCTCPRESAMTASCLNTSVHTPLNTRLDTCAVQARWAHSKQASRHVANKLA